MCTCSKLIESGNVSFYNQDTPLRESSEESNGEREKDVLSKALQTKEH
jgi:hypothetical protein